MVNLKRTPPGQVNPRLDPNFRPRNPNSPAGPSPRLSVRGRGRGQPPVTPNTPITPGRVSRPSIDPSDTSPIRKELFDTPESSPPPENRDIEPLLPGLEPPPDPGNIQPEVEPEREKPDPQRRMSFNNATVGAGAGPGSGLGAGPGPGGHPPPDPATARLNRTNTEAFPDRNDREAVLAFLTNQHDHLVDSVTDITARLNSLVTRSDDHQQRQDRIANLMDASGNGSVLNSTKGGQLKAHTYSGSGKESWRNFRNSFEALKEFNNWTDTQLKWALRHSVTGSAADAVEDIHPHKHPDFKSMLDAYEARFMPKAYSSLVRSAVESCRQRATESILSYHSRLRALYNRAYPGVKNDNIHMIETFIKGLRNKSVQQYVQRSRPETYSAALESALNEAAILDKSECEKSSEFSRYAHATGSVLESEGVSAMNLKCYFCSKPGHLKRDCKLLAMTRKRFPLSNRRNKTARARPTRFTAGRYSGRARAARFPPRRFPSSSSSDNKRKQVRRSLIAAIEAGEEEAAELADPQGYEDEDEEADGGDNLDLEWDNYDFTFDDYIASLEEEEIDTYLEEYEEEESDLDSRP